MPEIKLSRVVSVSSEDKRYPSSNLLGPVGSGRWKSANSGEKRVTVIIEFEKPSKLNGIHIGNEASAFVEVLVGKESTATDQDWKVALVASSLMTPADARSNQNTQKVRMFGADALSKAAVDDKWDRAKIICTQPFNHSIAYGLSFISFLTDSEEQTNPTAKSESNAEKIGGGFTLKGDSDSDDHESKGSLFSDRRRLQTDEPPPTAAASVRAAARAVDAKVSVQKPPSTSTHKTVNTQSTTAKATKPPSAASSTVTHSRETTKTVKPAASKPAPSSSITGTNTQPSKVSVTSAPSASAPPVPLNRVLAGVTFVLSGYQNPMRADLREKGLEMGARYRPDWNGSCTHLICAYSKTPKFSQVNGKGYIVSEDWILDSYKKEAKLNWRKYRLARSKTPPLDKDDKDTGPLKSPDKPKPKSNDSVPNVRPASASSTASSDKPVKKPEVKSDEAKKRKASGKGAVYDDSTDIDSDGEETTPAKRVKTAAAVIQSDSDATEMDTDVDEVEPSPTKNDSSDRGKQPANGRQVPAKSSLTNSQLPKASSSGQLPDLPDHLLEKTFFLYGNVSDRRQVFRYIHAYGGKVEEYMCDDVQFVVTDDAWDDNFDSALSDNPNLTFVKSQWIKDIHSKNRFLPHQKYAIVPK